LPEASPTLDGVTAVPWQLNPTPQSVGRVRRAVSTAAERAGAEPGSVALAALLVSEVVTNVVLHARTPYTVSVSGPEESGSRGRLRVAVSDRSAAMPSSRRHTPEATTGRGLRLLGSLAADHGVDIDQAGSGKTVWFEVPLREDDFRADDALLAAFEDPGLWPVGGGR
jgi:anti-sigma regulatory factor (Ser/Thr protein kinase)